MMTETNTIRRSYTKPETQVVELQPHTTLLIVSGGEEKQAQRRGYDLLDWDSDAEE